MSITPYLRALSGASVPANSSADAGLEDFLRLARTRLDESVELFDVHDWPGILALWQPLRASGLLDPQHPEWSDKSWYRCQVRSILMHQLMALVHSHFKMDEEENDLGTAMRWAFLYILRLVSDVPFMPEGFDSSLGEDAADASDHNLRTAFHTALQWFEMYGIEMIATITDAETEVVAALRDLLNERVAG